MWPLQKHRFALLELARRAVHPGRECVNHFGCDLFAHWLAESLIVPLERIVKRACQLALLRGAPKHFGGCEIDCFDSLIARYVRGLMFCFVVA